MTKKEFDRKSNYIIEFAYWYNHLVRVGFEPMRNYEDFGSFFEEVCKNAENYTVKVKDMLSVVAESRFLFGKKSDYLLRLIEY